MNENVMFIRVAAVDLSGMVEEMESLRYRLREMDKKLSTETQTWAQETGEVVRQYSDFRRAVQEALGYDQPELFTDTVLVEHVRMFRQRLVGVTAASLFESGAQVVVPMGGPFPGVSVTTEEAMAGATATAQAISDAVERDRATLADGSQARFFSDARPDEGPPTESMPPVKEPPPIASPQSIGRVFTRDYDWDLGDLMPADIINRSGDWWEFDHTPDGQNGDHAVYRCEALEKIHTFAELLHMHGTLWEVVQPESSVGGEDAHGSAVDHDQ